MPKINYYTVTQTREIKISANNIVDAAILSERIFDSTMVPEDRINIQQNPREIALDIREDRNATG